MVQMIVDNLTERVVGLRMVSAETGEIVQGGVAIKVGATKAVFDATIGINPSDTEEFVTWREPARSSSATA